MIEPARAGDSAAAVFTGCKSFVLRSCGLRPRLYAYACFAGSDTKCNAASQVNMGWIDLFALRDSDTLLLFFPTLF